MSASVVTPELLTLEQASDLLNVGMRSLHRWSSIGKAPRPVKITPGRRGCVRWRRGELLAWIEQGCPDLREQPSK